MLLFRSQDRDVPGKTDPDQAGGVFVARQAKDVPGFQIECLETVHPAGPALLEAFQQVRFEARSGASHGVEKQSVTVGQQGHGRQAHRRGDTFTRMDENLVESQSTANSSCERGELFRGQCPFVGKHRVTPDSRREATDYDRGHNEEHQIDSICGRVDRQ